MNLSLDWVEMADDDERNFIIVSKTAFQAIWGGDWTHPHVLKILERLHKLVQYLEKKKYFIGFPVILASVVMRRRILLSELVF